ncbi:MAG TPA: response regulator, partial [Thermoanaerobaculia bacterium]|nr:response regulator [Thermoanaerobaculia bacterium]
MPNPALIVAVADGEEETRSLMKRLMESEGYLALEAGDTESARRLAIEYPWDVMLLDSELTGGEGMPLCREIKSNPALGNRYVIVISSEVESAHKVRAFEAGADDYMSKPFESVELRARVRAWRRIIELQKQLVLTNARLEQLALVDPLTQVYNRRFFQQELTRAFDQARRHSRPLAVAMVDIDHFKRFNDT